MNHLFSRIIPFCFLLFFTSDFANLEYPLVMENHTVYKLKFISPKSKEPLFISPKGTLEFFPSDNQVNQIKRDNKTICSFTLNNKKITITNKISKPSCYIPKDPKYSRIIIGCKK